MAVIGNAQPIRRRVEAERLLLLRHAAEEQEGQRHREEEVGAAEDDRLRRPDHDHAHVVERHRHRDEGSGKPDHAGMREVELAEGVAGEGEHGFNSPDAEALGRRPSLEARPPVALRRCAASPDARPGSSPGSHAELRPSRVRRFRQVGDSQLRSPCGADRGEDHIVFTSMFFSL